MESSSSSIVVVTGASGGIGRAVARASSTAAPPLPVNIWEAADGAGDHDLIATVGGAAALAAGVLWRVRR